MIVLFGRESSLRARDTLSDYLSLWGWRFMRKTTQLVLAFVGLNVLGLLLLGWSVARSMPTDAALSPYWEVQAPEREVRLGGQRVYFRATSTLATASFYPGNGTMVAVAHAGRQLTVGEITGVNLTDRDNFIFCNVKVLVNSDQGVTLGMPKGTRIDSELVRLGGTADISVGEVATVHSGITGPFKVRVVGYMQLRGDQLLVVSPLNAKDTIQLGMSGSPIVQNGKLIGVLFARSRLPFVAGRYGKARLAADVYRATVGVVEWDAAASDLGPIAPNTIDPTEEQVRVAHRHIAAKHDIDLDRHTVVTGISPLPTIHTPVLTGENLINAAIQDAQREYRETTRFPPLILLDEDRRVLLVGYLQKDGRSVVIRYNLAFSGWTKTVTIKD